MAEELVSQEESIEARIERLKGEYPAFEERLTAVLEYMTKRDIQRQKNEFRKDSGNDPTDPDVLDTMKERALNRIKVTVDLLDRLEQEFKEDWAGRYKTEYAKYSSVMDNLKNPSIYVAFADFLGKLKEDGRFTDTEIRRTVCFHAYSGSTHGGTNSNILGDTQFSSFDLEGDILQNGYNKLIEELEPKQLPSTE